MDADDTKVAYIQLAFDWVSEHLGEAVGAAFRHEKAQALAALAAGMQELPDSGLPEDLQEQVRVRARYIRCQIECLEVPPAEEARLKAELIDEFQALRGSLVATGCARGYLLQLRTLALRDCGAAYPREEFNADLAATPVWGRSLEIYIYIASWAFLNRDLALLEECFSVFTVHSDGFMSDYLWQRANLMYQLLKGTAAARDLEVMLKRIQHPNQWQDFERVILPACIAAGLHRDDAVCAALGELLCKLYSSAPEMPKVLRATGKIMGD